MKTLRKPIFLCLPLLALFIIHPLQKTIEYQVTLSPTPTYDPLVEPPLPDHPTEYELGRNLYWHWCMTCHGDSGQGLTDEFRGIWEKDHQNCCGRGCHAGRPGDTAFPIPTVVPALVSDSQLAQFASVQELSAFLKTTHPPQSPGILKGEEYHAIAIFVFTMTGRSLVMIDTPRSTSTTIPTENAIPQQDVGFILPIVYVITTFVVIMIAVFLFVRRNHLRG